MPGSRALAPVAFQLEPNYPNPFNPQTMIPYAVPERTPVRLVVFNVLGQQVRTLVHGTAHDPEAFWVTWDGTDDRGINVGSGLYFYRLQAGDRVQTRKMLLLQ